MRGEATRPLAALLAALAIGCGDDSDADESAGKGKAAEVAGVQYTAYLSRQLNPAQQPAEAWLGDHRFPPGMAAFGVFLEACNTSGQVRYASERLTIEDSRGNVHRPIDLAADKPFDYEGTRLEPGECTPAPGAENALTGGGALVAFEVPREAFDNRPWRLMIRTPVGTPREEQAQIELDL